jgi:hypothetical protein
MGTTPGKICISVEVPTDFKITGPELRQGAQMLYDLFNNITSWFDDHNDLSYDQYMIWLNNLDATVLSKMQGALCKVKPI